MKRRWNAGASSMSSTEHSAPSEHLLPLTPQDFVPSWQDSELYVWWPAGFKIFGVDTYDGKANPV